jgi:hypothetical protein
MDRLDQLRQEAHALLDTAIRERRELDGAEERTWQTLYAEICELRGEMPLEPMTGDGWRIIPTRDDDRLESVAREIWNIGLRLPWPSGWQVRFADLFGRHDGYAAVTLYAPHRLILVDRENYLERGDPDLERSLHEELAHVAVGWAEDHGALFHTTLNEIRARCPKLIPAWRDSR